MPMLFDEHETSHIRIWGETHPHLGGCTSVSRRRHIRIWEEAHPYLGGDAPVSGTRNDRI